MPIALTMEHQTFSYQGVQLELSYLAEGAANVVYKITPISTNQDIPAGLQGALLRFRKKSATGTSCVDIVRNFNKHFKKLFPSDSLVEQSLFPLPPGLLAGLNLALKESEINETRSKKRVGVYLDEMEPYGILVTDLTPRTNEETLVELKPKWLVQSRSAPPGAKRCRTCALREQRRAGGVLAGGGYADFCPLDLCSQDDSVLIEASKYIAPGHTEELGEIFKERVRPLMMRLKDLQIAYGRVGLQDFNPQDSILHTNSVDPTSMYVLPPERLLETSIGMTLRDTILLIRYRPEKSYEEADVKLADLDLKTTGNAKLEKWSSTEQQLIEGGWYLGAEDADSRGKRFCKALETT